MDIDSIEIEKILHKLKSFGAQSLGHINGDLEEHLKGTYKLLRDWGNADYICLAGFYHAVYGTHGFPQQLVTLEYRTDIAKIIGKKAEELVYFYGACDRTYTYNEIIYKEHPSYKDRFTGKIFTPSKNILLSFCELTLANELEIAKNNEKFREQYGNELIKLFCKMDGYVSTDGFNYFKEVFSIK